MGYSRQFEAVAVPSAEVIRRRLHRRRIRLAAVTGSAAGMLAVGAVAAVAAIPAWRLTGQPNAGHHATASSLGWLPAGPELPGDAGPEAAPYVVTLGLEHRGLGLHASVHDWRTGTFLGQVRAPGGRCFQQVMGASDDRTFLLSERGCHLYIRTWFYELRLTRSGHPEPLIPIRLPLSLRYDGTFALSPDGTHLAYATFAAGHRPNKSTVTMYDLMTGAKRTWSGPGLVGNLAWAGDRTLALGLGWNKRTPPTFAVGWRLLDTAAPGSSLLASRALTRLNGLDLLPAARNVMYAAPIRIVGETVRNELARYSARTGRLEITFKPWSLIGRNYTWCDPLWTDGSGVHVLAVCGTPNYGMRIDGNRMRLVKLPFPVEYMQPSTNTYFFAF